MGEVLEGLGAGVAWREGSVTIDATELTSVEAPYELVRRMRASTAVLGSLLARAGRARVAMPGGDEIGSRPIDLHVQGLRKMGAEIVSEHGFLVASTSGLRGAAITLDYPSVGATENLMMAAVLARGTTVIDNAAREPEIADIATFLGLDGRAHRRRRHQHDRDRRRRIARARRAHDDRRSHRGGNVGGRCGGDARRRDDRERATRPPRSVPAEALRRGRRRGHDRGGAPRRPGSTRARRSIS